MSFAIAKIPTPLLNTPNFTELQKDDQGLLRAVETVCLPGSKFEILRDLGDIVQVKTKEYAGDNLFAHKRCLAFVSHCDERVKQLYMKKEILERLEAMLGSAYIWGGNWHAGVPEMEPFFDLKGVDCSGLLYEATNGFTPRNTSELVNFGHEVTGKLEPLDLIVWKGHVLIVFDENTTIESKLSAGVIKSKLALPDRAFSLRRWYPTA